jgi:PAS domain S-box-containing protein
MKKANVTSRNAEHVSKPKKSKSTHAKMGKDLERHLLNALLENAPDYIYFKDTENRFIRTSRAHAKAFGLKDPAEAVGKTDFDFFTEEHARAAYEDEQEVMRTGKALSREEKETWADRPDTWVLTTKMPLRDVNGEIIGTFGISKDITERKEAQHELLASEKRYRTLVDNALVGIYQTNLEGIIQYSNHALARILNFKSPADLIGTKVIERYKNSQERARLLESLKREKQVRDFETELLTRDGKVRTVLISCTLEEDSLSGMIMDITKRKLAEDRIHLFRSLIDQSNDAIEVIDPRSGRILDVNASETTELGYSRKEIIKLCISDIDPTVDPSSFPMDKESLKTMPLLTEGIHMRKDGSTFPVEVSSKFVHLDRDYLVNVARNISERKLAEERIQAKINQLAALRTIDMAITGSLDLRVTLDVLLNQLILLMQVDAADVLLADSQMGMLNYAEGGGFRTQALQHTHLRIGEGYAGKAALERRTIKVSNLIESPDGLARAPQLAQEGFITYFAVPLLATGKLKGVLEIFHRAPLEGGQDWLDMLEALAGQAAIAIDNATLFADLQQSNLDLSLAYDTTLEGWTRTLDLRDKETEGHTQRVAEMTTRLASMAGMSDNELVHVRRGALLHDIGKMGIPDNILLKPGKLTDEEWEVMKKHPVYAYDLLSPIKYLHPALDIPYCHHEKWDGSGYPRGLKKEDIPLAARIFTVVDVWDALRSDRPYRKAWPEEKALAYIREQSGKHFDPNVVDAFFKLISSRGETI